MQHIQGISRNRLPSIKKNEHYNPNYILNIQEKDQEISSLLGFEKAALIQKNSPNQVEDIQGKHPVKNHSMTPLC